MALFYITIAKTNALTQADIGALSILSFISSTFILITGLALPTALTKFASEHLGKNQPQEAASVVRTTAKTVVLLSFTGFVIAVALAEHLSQYLFGTPVYAPLIILILIHTLLFSIITVCRSTLQALYLFGKMATLTITFIIISRVTGATLALLQMGLNGVLIGYLAGSIITLAVALIFVRGRLPKPTHNTSLKPILIFSLPLFLSNLTLLILVQIFLSLKTNHANQKAYQKLPPKDQQILQTVKAANRHHKGTTQDIASTYEKLHDEPLTLSSLHETLSTLQDVGLIKQTITNHNDQPILTWKTTIALP